MSPRPAPTSTVTLSTWLPASFALTPSLRATPQNLAVIMQHYRLAHFYLSYALTALAADPLVPPRLRTRAAAPPPELEVPKALRPLHDATSAWLYGWVVYAAAHRRAPEEIAADNWHWATECFRWPAPPLTGRMARQLPYKVIPTQPGIVRVSWFFEVKEMFGLEARRHPEMYAHLALEPDGSLRIGDVRRQWGMENMYFVEWSPQRFCLWPSTDGETLSAVAVRHLLSTNEQYPFLRVIEQPTPQRERIRALRTQHLLNPHTAPPHMRVYLRMRHALFRGTKAYHAVRRPLLTCDALPLFPVERRRLADALCIVALALAIFVLLWSASCAVEAVRTICASSVGQAVGAWVRSEPELVRVAERVWAAVCALPAFVFWVLTIPVWTPVWLGRTALREAWWAGTALVRAGIEAGIEAGRGASMLGGEKIATMWSG